jgi:hypothetical protein
MFAQFDRFEIKMTKAQAESAAHPGPCDVDVARLLASPSIKKQLAKISNEDLAKELREYGAWDSVELRDREANEARIIWIAAGNIVETLNYKGV